MKLCEAPKAFTETEAASGSNSCYRHLHSVLFSLVTLPTAIGGFFEFHWGTRKMVPLPFLLQLEDTGANWQMATLQRELGCSSDMLLAAALNANSCSHCKDSHDMTVCSQNPVWMKPTTIAKVGNEHKSFQCRLLWEPPGMGSTEEFWNQPESLVSDLISHSEVNATFNIKDSRSHDQSIKVFTMVLIWTLSH